MLSVLNDTPSVRRFFAAFLQSQIGNAAAYVALLLVAYSRLHSGWGISLVLLGEFVPGIVLAPLFGSFADRRSRRELLICSDLLRGGCFVGLAVVSWFPAMVMFASLAGVGSALFRPTVNAALPGLVSPDRRSELTALFYGCVNAGLLLGPALAAALLLLTTAPVLLLANAGTFLISAALLTGLDLGPHGTEANDADAAEDAPGSAWSSTCDGARALAGIPDVLVVMVVGALVVLTGAVFNVAAPLLATGPLHAGSTGYSILMMLYGAGMLAGSWANARAGSEVTALRRRWLSGIFLSGVAMSAAALAPNLVVAFVTFALIGLGENLLVGPEMRLVQESVGERLLGRAFGFKDVLENIAFATAFLGSGVLLSLVGVRIVFVTAGLVTVGLSMAGWMALRGRSAPALALAASEELPLIGRSGA